MKYGNSQCCIRSEELMSRTRHRKLRAICLLRTGPVIRTTVAVPDKYMMYGVVPRTVINSSGQSHTTSVDVFRAPRGRYRHFEVETFAFALQHRTATNDETIDLVELRNPAMLEVSGMLELPKFEVVIHHEIAVPRVKLIVACFDPELRHVRSHHFSPRLGHQTTQTAPRGDASKSLLSLIAPGRRDAQRRRQIAERQKLEHERGRQSRGVRRLLGARVEFALQAMEGRPGARHEITQLNRGTALQVKRCVRHHVGEPHAGAQSRVTSIRSVARGAP